MSFSRPMSTSPDTRTEDRLITLISRWLGRHIGNAELHRGIQETGSDGLGPGQLEALSELSERVDSAAPGERGELEMIARETLEALALGE
jgi:hypothetical protein